MKLLGQKSQCRGADRLRYDDVKGCVITAAATTFPASLAVQNWKATYASGVSTSVAQIPRMRFASHRREVAETKPQQGTNRGC
jgi:hypothetical protein